MRLVDDFGGGRGAVGAGGGTVGGTAALMRPADSLRMAPPTTGLAAAGCGPPARGVETARAMLADEALPGIGDGILSGCASGLTARIANDILRAYSPVASAAPSGLGGSAAAGTTTSGRLGELRELGDDEKVGEQIRGATLEPAPGELGHRQRGSSKALRGRALSRLETEAIHFADQAQRTTRDRGDRRADMIPEWKGRDAAPDGRQRVGRLDIVRPLTHQIHVGVESERRPRRQTEDVVKLPQALLPESLGELVPLDHPLLEQDLAVEALRRGDFREAIRSSWAPLMIPLS